jgi:hypothetical protein
VETEPVDVVKLTEKWYALPAAVRGLLSELALARLDGDLIEILADWLEEHGHHGAARVRLLRPRPGDVVGVLAATNGPADQILAQGLVAQLGREGIAAVRLLRTDGGTEDLTLLLSNWVRQEELDRARQSPPWV